MRSALTLLALTTILLLAIAACGGDDDAATPSPTAAPTTPAAATTSSAQTPTSGPSTGIDLSVETPEFIAYGAGQGDFPSDQPGLAIADFNGDGIDDFAAGARFADPNGSQDAGAVYVVFGSSSLPETVDFAAGEEDIAVYGAGPGANLGFSAATGDLNGDGAADLILGSPFATVDAAQRGTVNVLFGPLSGGTIDLAKTAADVTLSGVTATGFFGDSVATGDVNGDGTDDLVIGATFGAMISPPATQVGAVYVFLGDDSWASQLTATDADSALFGLDQFDELGDFVVTGDINADGIDDVIATAEAADGPDNTRGVGAEVHILFGRRTFERTYEAGEEDMVIYGALENDTLGFALATGDLDGDGTDDLAMSAHLAAGGGVTRSGVVYVLYGRDDLPGEIDLLTPPDGIAMIHGAGATDLLATSMAIANVGGDAATELVLGGSFVDARGRSDAGAIYTVDGLSLEGAVTVGHGKPTGGQWDGAAASERLGSNVGVGDLDGDGFPEIVTIAEGGAGPNESRPGAGRVYIINP